jgi:glyoxylase-like metal-dependent hydrolase (beta-lactamase superfamily II)
MAEILPGIHLVEGVDPSPDSPTHVYLVKDKGATWTLVDTGLPGASKAIMAYLAQHKIPPAAVKSIVLTHLHRDHTGSLKDMSELTRARTYSHWIEAAYIAMDPPYDGPGVPPERPNVVDEKFKDGDTLDLMGGAVVYHTPGHTPGHSAFYLPDRGILFSGDLFFPEGNKVELTPPMYTHHTLTAKISARRVAGLRIESLMAYHGGPVLKGARAAVENLVKRL